MFNSFNALVNTPFFTPSQPYGIFSSAAFIWGPVLLVWLAQKLWLDYVRMKFIKENFEFILLEIKLPREIHKLQLLWNLFCSLFFNLVQRTGTNDGGREK